MIRYLLDTNVLSEPMKSSPNTAVLAKLRDLDGQYATCALVIEELLYGLNRLQLGTRRRDAIQAYVDALLGSSLPVLPFDLEAAKWHGPERARLRALGRPAPLADSQIAAIAFVHSLVLVTRNTKDFQHHDGLQVEGWFA